MGLKHITIPEALVALPGGDSFAVRGLCFDDLAYLVRRHGAKLKKLFEDFTERSGKLVHRFIE